MEFLLLIFLIITLSFLLVKIFESIGLPRVLGPILIGFIFSIFAQRWGITHTDALESIASLGIIMLLFYIGLELNLKDVKSQGKQTVLVALLSFFLTFICGFLFTYVILDASIIVSFVVGAIVSVTAEGIIVGLLEESRLLKSRAGEVIVGAGLIDDILGLVMLMLITLYVTLGDFSLLSLVPLVVGFITFLLGYHFLNHISRFIDEVFESKKITQNYDLFTFSIIFLLIFAIFSDLVGLDFSIGAILAGLLLNFSLQREGRKGKMEEHKIDNLVKYMSFGFLSYFFFFWIGFNIDLSVLTQNWEIGIILAVLAFVMKYVGAAIAGYFSGDSLKESSFIGIGMSSKGGIELVIAEIARKAGLIGPDIFSAVVIMSVILIIVGPVVFNLMKGTSKSFKSRST